MGFSRTGHDDSLILLHGLGPSRAVWDPIVPSLVERFDVIAVDLPGFSSRLPALYRYGTDKKHFIRRGE